MMLRAIGRFVKGLLSGPDRWDYFKLYNFLHTHQKAGILPRPVEFPKQLWFNSGFWSEVKNIFDLTFKDEHERELSVYWIDGDLVFTKHIRGERSSVTAKHSIKVTYSPKSRDYYEKVVYFNGTVVFKKHIASSRVPKKIEIYRMFSLHTHPPHKSYGLNGDATVFYTFFSPTDINSLLASKDLASGLITDKVYLLFKTSLIKLSRVDRQEKITIRKLLNWGFVLYKSEFSDKIFNRIEFEDYVTAGA